MIDVLFYFVTFVNVLAHCASVSCIKRQYRSVTDGQTDGYAVALYCACRASFSSRCKKTSLYIVDAGLLLLTGEELVNQWYGEQTKFNYSDPEGKSGQVTR